MLRNIYNYFIKDALYKSSLLVLASSMVQAILGFVFWVLIARIYPTKSVGIATTLLSVSTVLNGFSSLGLFVSLVRYLPRSQKRNKIINTSLLLTGFASLICAGIFLLSLRFLSPHLLFLQSNSFYILSFSIFLVFSTWSIALDSSLMAYHSSGNLLFKNVVFSILKLIFPFFFISWGAYGIFTAFSLALVLSTLLSFVILFRVHRFVPSFSFDTMVIRELFHFSLGNYLTNFLYQIPLLVLPLLIVNLLRPEAAAYFYIAYTIASVQLLIPNASTLALLTEGSYNKDGLRKQLIKTIAITLILLIPAVGGTFLLGKQVLHFFGEHYASDTYGLLCLFSIASFFTTIVLISSVILKLRHKIKKLVYLNILGCIIILASSLVFISHGLTALGIGWLIGQALMSLLFMEVLFKELRSRK